MTTTSSRIVSVLAAVTASLMLAATSALADIPQQINYQGYLTSGGTPVNASLQMVFKIYNVPTGGSALWSETQMVTVNNGLYNALLGSVTPINLPFDVPYYLGLTVGADAEMAPRQALASAPYAMRAGCIPGDRVTCYSPGGDPPAGCNTGIRTCNAQGTAWGSCVGEVAPNCGGNCVNLQTDPNNCGTCGHQCAGTNGTDGCTAGLCTVVSCNAGYANCDGNAANGCETFIATDVNNCGGCGLHCSSNNGTPSCGNSTCGIACNAGFTNCNGLASDGCECATPTCCGAVCATTHPNGLGQSYFDCAALNTYNHTEAQSAALAWNANFADLFDAICGGGGTNNVVYSQSATQCAVWQYVGTAVGHVTLNSPNSNCICPLVSDPVWH